MTLPLVPPTPNHLQATKKLLRESGIVQLQLNQPRTQSHIDLAKGHETNEWSTNSALWKHIKQPLAIICLRFRRLSRVRIQPNKASLPKATTICGALIFQTSEQGAGKETPAEIAEKRKRSLRRNHPSTPPMIPPAFICVYWNMQCKYMYFLWFIQSQIFRKGCLYFVFSNHLLSFSQLYVKIKLSGNLILCILHRC